MDFKRLGFRISLRLFSMLSHYTNSIGAKGIMKNGFKNLSNQPNGISFFHELNDFIKNNPNANLSTMLDNIEKRNNRKYIGKGNNSESPLNIKSKYSIHGVPMTSISNEQNKDDIHYMDRNINGLNYYLDDNENLKVTFPKEYKQYASIDGLRDKSGPIYRVVTDPIDKTKVTKFGYEYEHRTEPENIDKSSTKIEIPRGMYNGNKRIKRQYIKDYKDFNPKDFNKNDKTTSENIDDIERKIAFLSKGHGKIR